ncbi:hypothetical protein T439DRAFT_183285 [Meredithblackwellia eburnea MCA 4105]
MGTSSDSFSKLSNLLETVHQPTSDQDIVIFKHIWSPELDYSFNFEDMKFELGAKTWRNPVAEKEWQESEKKRLAELAEKKKADEEKKLLEEEQNKLILEEMVSSGRSQAIETAEARLAQLRADVAALEAKAAGYVFLYYLTPRKNNHQN